MSMAIINLSNYDEIVYDLNVQLFNILPSMVAKRKWNELDEMIQGGLTEEAAYNYVNGWIKYHLNKEQNSYKDR